MNWLIAALIIVLVIEQAFPQSKLWRDYWREVDLSRAANRAAAEAAAEPPSPREETPTLCAAKIAHLPPLIRAYIETCRYLDTPLAQNMRVDFGLVKFRLSPGARQRKIFYQQHNFVARPDRHAFISLRVCGLPCQGKDTFLAGKGSMTGILAKHLRLFQIKGSEMDQGQMVTMLADAALLPSFWLQDGLSWRQLDETRVEVTFAAFGREVKGVYHGNEAGEITQFTTEDRFLAKGKQMLRTPWCVRYHAYQTINGLCQPDRMQAVWLPADGEDLYFDGSMISVKYDV